jgi:hypothetical protein
VYGEIAFFPVRVVFLNKEIGEESPSQPTSVGVGDASLADGFLIVNFPKPHDDGVLRLKNKNRSLIPAMSYWTLLQGCLI